MDAGGCGHQLTRPFGGIFFQSECFLLLLGFFARYVPGFRSHRFGREIFALARFSCASHGISWRRRRRKLLFILPALGLFLFSLILYENDGVTFCGLRPLPLPCYIGLYLILCQKDSSHLNRKRNKKRSNMARKRMDEPYKEIRAGIVGRDRVEGAFGKYHLA